MDPQGTGLNRKRKAVSPIFFEPEKKAKTDAAFETSDWEPNKSDYDFDYYYLLNAPFDENCVVPDENLVSLESGSSESSAFESPSFSSQSPNPPYEANNTNTNNTFPVQDLPEQGNILTEGKESLLDIDNDEERPIEIPSSASVGVSVHQQPGNLSFRVAVPGKTRGLPSYESLVAKSIPYNEVNVSSRTVLWCILDAKNATMKILRKKAGYEVPCKEKPDGPSPCQIAEKTYILYKWSPQHDHYQIQWLIDGKEVLTAEMKFTKSKPETAQKVSRTVAAQLPANQTLPRSSAELPLASINVLFVVSDDNLFHQLTLALQDLDFELQINCDQGQLCLYTRGGVTNDNIVVLKYSAPKHLKVITECNVVVDEVLFLLPSADVTVSISRFIENNRPLEVKKFENNLGTEASIDELPKHLAQAVRHSLDCCKNVNVGALALSNSETPEELSYYLASWLARCVPMHRKNVYLCFKLKHTTAELISDVAKKAIAAITSRVGQVNEKGHAYGCIAVLFSCSPLQHMFIEKQQHNISSDLEVQGQTLILINQMTIDDVEAMLKDKSNEPFKFSLFDLLCEMLHNGSIRKNNVAAGQPNRNRKQIVESDSQLVADYITSQIDSNFEDDIEAMMKEICELSDDDEGSSYDIWNSPNMLNIYPHC